MWAIFKLLLLELFKNERNKQDLVQATDETSYKRNFDIIGKILDTN